MLQKLVLLHSFKNCGRSVFDIVTKTEKNNNNKKKINIRTNDLGALHFGIVALRNIGTSPWFLTPVVPCITYQTWTAFPVRRVLGTGMQIGKNTFTSKKSVRMLANSVQCSSNSYRKGMYLLALYDPFGVDVKLWYHHHHRNIERGSKVHVTLLDSTNAFDTVYFASCILWVLEVKCGVFSLESYHCMIIA